MQKTVHSYTSEVLSPRKCQAKNSAPASNHEVWSTCLTRFPLLRVPACPTSQGWVGTPTIPLGGSLVLRRLLKSFMRLAISTFAVPDCISLRKWRWTYRSRSSRIIWGESGINWWNPSRFYSCSLLSDCCSLFWRIFFNLLLITIKNTSLIYGTERASTSRPPAYLTCRFPAKFKPCHKMFYVSIQRRPLSIFSY
jgi:hypothetical protein